MTTPITPLRMPLELKERAKKQAARGGFNLSQYIFMAVELSVMRDELDEWYGNN